MSTTVIINPKTGLGQPINPNDPNNNYKPMTSSFSDHLYIKFHKENPPLSVISAAGETLRDGRYQCEKVDQLYSLTVGWVDKKNVNDISKSFRQARQVWKVIETPELPGKETVEELAEKYYWSDDAIKHDGINRINHAYIAGYKEALAHSIDRDKVTGAIEKFYFPNSLSEHQQVVNEVLTDLLQVIKEMK